MFNYSTKEKKSSATARNGKLFFQPKLSNDQPNDIYEQEANAAVERVMQTSALQQPILSPSHIQLKEDANQTATSSQTENPISSLPGGKPLGNEARSFFEPRMGYDFSNVRLHNDTHQTVAYEMK